MDGMGRTYKLMTKGITTKGVFGVGAAPDGAFGGVGVVGGGAVAGAAGRPVVSAGLAEQMGMMRDPVKFVVATRSFGEGLVRWQEKFLGDMRCVDGGGRVLEGEGVWPRNVLLSSVNGGGKTKLLASCIRYLLATVPGCVIPVTSSVYRQMEMLKSYFDKQQGLDLFPGWVCTEGKLVSPNGNYCRWFATDNVGAVESFHAQFLVRVLDEVKSMADEIVDATNRWQPKLSIWVSSKGVARGRFYDAMTIHRDRWRVHEVRAEDCPWFLEGWIKDMVREHGGDSSLVKSMINNEFSDYDIRNLVGLDAVNACREAGRLGAVTRWGAGEEGVVAGVDLSAAKKGGDECVVYHRKGNKVEEPYIIAGASSEMEVVGIVLRRLKEIKARHAFVDAGGLGAAMCARLEELVKGDGSLTINRVNFGGRPLNRRGLYTNRGSEMWGVLAERIEKREIFLPDDARTLAQLTSREVEPQSDGQLQLVSKEVMRRKGLHSPDRADALVMCLCQPAHDFGLKTDKADFSTEKWDGLIGTEGIKEGTTGDGRFDLGM